MVSWSPPPLPPRLEASRKVALVGRESELRTMEGVWATVENGSRHVVFLGGEPGAGKTRFAAEIAGALSDHDVTVLVGTSSADAAASYEPFREMLDHLFFTSPEGSLRHLLEDIAPQLQRLSSHISRHCPDLEEGSGAESDVRLDLFDAVAQLFRGLADERPLALIAEDLHWARSPTIGLLEHVIQACPDVPLLVLGTFRSTPPDRSDELSSRMADLHRLDGVRRIDLEGLDTDAIARYINVHAGVPIGSARASAAILRDRTGGNPFFLRELWVDLEQRGGLSALRSSQRVPASIGDTLSRRLGGLTEGLRGTIELAAVIGDTFDLHALVAASEVDAIQSMAAVDSAMALGLIEPAAGQDNAYSFVHSLTREAVMDQLAPSRVTIMHARVAEALERLGSGTALVPRLAHHYLAAQVIGYHEQALQYALEAGRLAEQSLAFEEAAVWFERAASLPGVDVAKESEALSLAAANHLRAGDFARARDLYDRLFRLPDPLVRLEAAMGYEDANWRPGLADLHAADLMTAAIDGCGLDEGDSRYVRALGSLGRALAFAGQTGRARQVGNRAIELARRLGDEETISHTLKTSLWHGLTPDVAEVQLARASELSTLSRDRGDHETLGAAAYFRAMAAYMCGQPGDLEGAAVDCRRAAQAAGQPFFFYVSGCVTQGMAFMQGDFPGAERWAERTLSTGDSFGADTVDGPFGVQMYMVKRETGGLAAFRHHLDGREAFHGRWVPGLLALYTELGIEQGIRRTLRHLLSRTLAAHTAEAQWPMELIFMTEGTLALEDRDASETLLPFLEEYRGINMVAGQFVAVFGSADHYLGRIAALLGEDEEAELLFSSAAEMNHRMGSVVHTAQTLAHHASFLAARRDFDRSAALSDQARELAEPIGQMRVLNLVDSISTPAGPAGLTERELEVLRLLADGLSNREIGDRLFISGNTAANHVRSILVKTGAANRTQAAIYASDHDLL